MTGAIILMMSLGARAEGHGDTLVLPALPHVRAVGLADEEVHVNGREIHFGNEIVVAEKLLDSAKSLI